MKISNEYSKMTIDKPKVILFRGMPGVGKTFISNKVAERLGIAIVKKDDFYDYIHSFINTHELRNKICYDIIYQLIDTNLKTKVDLIIDCPFRDHSDLDKLTEFVRNRDGILKAILCVCHDQELWATRFNKRSSDPKPNNLITDFENLKMHYQTLHLENYKDELVLDTQQNAECLILEVQRFLGCN